MFYAHFVLAKKGPLARIWLAAHWDKKLTKAHVFETNIEKSVEGILQPKVKMALRTSGHLLLGVVRIYSRKAKYLLQDCNEAFIKIRMAFRPGMVDLPEENREAAVNAITLPEVFHDFDATVPELSDVDIQAQFSLNQSRAEEITMREDYGNISLVPGDDGFGDMGFEVEPPELIRETAHMESTRGQADLLFRDGDGHGSRVDGDGVTLAAQPSVSSLATDAPMRDDGFGGTLGQDIMAGGLFEGSLFDDGPMPDVPSVDTGAPSVPPPLQDDRSDSDDDRPDFGGPPSVGGASSDGSRPASPIPGPSTEMPPPPTEEPVPSAMADKDTSAAQDQTTLLQNEDESFALAPIDTSALKGWVKAKRKRKLIIDEVKNISGEEMKAQLSDTTDIITNLDLAAPSKRLMHWKETGGVEKLFALLGRPIPARVLFKNYQRHLTSHPVDNDDFGLASDQDPFHLEQVREDGGEPQPIDPATPGLRRITRKRKYPEAEEYQKQLAEQEAFQKQQQEAQMLAQQMMNQSAQPPQLPPEMGQHPGMIPGMMTDPTMVAGMNQMHVPQTDQFGQQLPFMDQQNLLQPQTDPTLNQVSLLQQQNEVMAPQTEQQPDMSHPGAGQQGELPNMGFDQGGEQQLNDMGYGGTHPPATTPGAFSEGGRTPFHEIEFPASVGPPEEQAEDETYEEYEERVLNKRAAHMVQIIRNRTKRDEQLSFWEMIHRNTKKQAAQKFYTLLVLKKHQAVELSQKGSYEDIIISKGPKIDSAELSV